MKFLDMAHKLVVDTMTGPDGVTWALGRFYSAPMMGVGLWIIADTHLHNRAAPTMGDLGIGLAGVGAAAMMMISGTKNADTPGLGFMERLMPTSHEAALIPASSLQGVTTK